MTTTEERPSSSYQEEEESHTILEERLTGTVKWFNNRHGYGFITVCDDGLYKGKDIFVHYKSIDVKNSQYKYLVQGEYVDFTLVKSMRENHEYQAINVSGVKGGPILCETRKKEDNSSSPIKTKVYYLNENKSSLPFKTKPNYFDENKSLLPIKTKPYYFDESTSGGGEFTKVVRRRSKIPPQEKKIYQPR